jgi:ElaB/YqjD/DUF883 family membrane-anchored ribosome-binding protein
MKSTNPSANNSDGQKSPERLEREVDQVRERLGRTVNELSYRLSPGELLDQALHMAREHGGEFGRNLATQVKHNPIPLLLTGLGLSWLMLASNDPYPRYSPSADYTTYDLDDYPDELDDYPENSHHSGIKETLDHTVERTRRAKQAVTHTVHDVSENVRAKVRAGGASATHLFEQHPLISGSLGVALGAALGALIPPTQTEDRLLGSFSDEATEKVTSLAQEGYEKARDKGREVVQQVKEATQDSDMSF